MGERVTAMSVADLELAQQHFWEMGIRDYKPTPRDMRRLPTKDAWSRYWEAIRDLRPKDRAA